jgi:hypothetical protein
MPITINGVPQVPGNNPGKSEQYSIDNTRNILAGLAAVQAIMGFVGVAKELGFRVDDDLYNGTCDGFDRGVVVYNGDGNFTSCQWSSTGDQTYVGAKSSNPDFRVTSRDGSRLSPGLAKGVIAACSNATTTLRNQAASV